MIVLYCDLFQVNQCDLIFFFSLFAIALSEQSFVKVRSLCQGLADVFTERERESVNETGHPIQVFKKVKLENCTVSELGCHYIHALIVFGIEFDGHTQFTNRHKIFCVVFDLHGHNGLSDYDTPSDG